MFSYIRKTSPNHEKIKAIRGKDIGRLAQRSPVYGEVNNERK